jgi:hypothetical protein
MDPITAILALLPAKYAVYVLAGMGASAIASACWKQPAADSRWFALWNIVNKFGANVWHAKNAPAS